MQIRTSYVKADRQTDTTEITYHAASRVVNESLRPVAAADAVAAVAAAAVPVAPVEQPSTALMLLPAESLQLNGRPFRLAETAVASFRSTLLSARIRLTAQHRREHQLTTRTYVREDLSHKRRHNTDAVQSINRSVQKIIM